MRSVSDLADERKKGKLLTLARQRGLAISPKTKQGRGVGMKGDSRGLNNGGFT